MSREPAPEEKQENRRGRGVPDRGCSALQGAEVNKSRVISRAGIQRQDGWRAEHRTLIPGVGLK